MKTYVDDGKSSRILNLQIANNTRSFNNNLDRIRTMFNLIMARDYFEIMNAIEPI